MGGYDTYGTLDSPSEDGGFEEKCGICRHWFWNEAEWKKHYTKRDYGCRDHEICFRRTDIYDHALDEKHDSCFVTTCRSKFANEGGSSNDTIIQHVKDDHMDEAP